MSIVTIAQLSNSVSVVNRDRNQAVYWAEGAVSRMIWLLRYDREKNPSRDLGKSDYKELEGNKKRYLADGTAHKMNYYGGKVEIQIFDMASGVRLDGSEPEKYLVKKPEEFEDEQAFDDYQAFINSLCDYVDGNSFTQLTGGFEVDDYENIGMAPLPRNYPMQFREEILWIPGALKYFKPDAMGRLSFFQVVALTGMPRVAAKKNFFSASRKDLMNECGFNEEQVDEIIQAKVKWRREKEGFSKLLDPNLLKKLEQKFSFRESGFYTFVIKAYPGKNMAGRSLVCSIQVSTHLPFRDALPFYEWQFIQ